MSIEDLSAIHRPITSLFPSLKDDDFDRYCLSSDDVEFFHEKGYLAGVQLLDVAQIEVLKRELTEFFDPEHAGHDLWHEYHANESVDPERVLFHALGAWRLRSGFHDILWNPAFLIPASQLLGGGVRFWHDQLFYKPAMHGGNVAWHQDYSYWTRTQPMAHLTCWTGLDRATQENGCLQYIPGSHHWDLLPITGLSGDMAAIRNVLTEEQWEAFQNPVPIELEPGQCAFHHPLMVHGSFDNQTDLPRRAEGSSTRRTGRDESSF